MSDSSFFDRLYQGFEAEYFVVGKLFGAGLEAFKLPADFGFDLLVSNQRELSLSIRPLVARAHQFPYVLQVKSRRISADHFRQGPNDRTEVKVSFWVNASEFDLLRSEDRSYLVLVVHLPRDAEALGHRSMCVWLKGSQLPRLLSTSYLSASMDKRGRERYQLDMLLRFKPASERDSIVKRLVERGQLTSDGAKELEALIPQKLPSTWKAKEYAALMRCQYTSKVGYNGAKSVAKKLRPEHLDLSFIGSAVQFPTQDECEEFPAV